MDRGGGMRDAEALRRELPHIPLHALKGNCDFASREEDTATFLAGPVTVFATHGDRYGVKYGTDSLINAGYFAGAKLVLFGHTHRPLIIPGERNWPAALNPGSCSRPRGPEGPTFAVLTLEKGQPPHMEIRRLREGGSQ